MTESPKRGARVPTHNHVIAALACGTALCLAVPATAFASASTSSQRASAARAPHNTGDATSHAEVSGSVVSVGGGSVVVEDRAGFWRTVVLETTTTYSDGPMIVTPAVSVSDVAVGEQIAARGVVDLNHTSLDATSVRIELATMSGTVASITASSLTVTGGHGSTVETIDLTPQTVVFARSGTVALSSVVVGSHVTGFGVLESDGSLSASYLGVRSMHQHSDAKVLDHSGSGNAVEHHSTKS